MVLSVKYLHVVTGHAVRIAAGVSITTFPSTRLACVHSKGLCDVPAEVDVEATAKDLPAWEPPPPGSDEEALAAEAAAYAYTYGYGYGSYGAEVLDPSAMMSGEALVLAASRPPDRTTCLAFCVVGRTGGCSVLGRPEKFTRWPWVIGTGTLPALQSFGLPTCSGAAAASCWVGGCHPAPWHVLASWLACGAHGHNTPQLSGVCMLSGGRKRARPHILVTCAPLARLRADC
jgi:hypothetical protein